MANGTEVVTATKLYDNGNGGKGSLINDVT